jgi:AraC-like DNA-binding protein
MQTRQDNPDMADPARPSSSEVLLPVAADEAANLIADCRFRSPRLDELEDVLSNVGTSHKLIPAARGMPLDGEFQLHAARDLAVFDLRFGCGITAELAPHEIDDRVAFAMPTRGRTLLRLRGEEFATSDRCGVIIPAGPPAVIRFTEDCVTRTVVMNRHRIAEYCAKLLGREIGDPLAFEAQLRLDDATGQSWLRLVEYAATELADPRSLARRWPAACQQLEQMVMTGFLLSHSHTYSLALQQPQGAAAPYYVKRAEAYIEAHFMEPLSLAEIAAQAGVSARSLQNGFQNFRHMTPMAFLRRVRLEHAHRALLRADPTHATVTDIAIGSGFSHMGEFASHYKRTYGVSPRETLMKKTSG